MVSPLFESTSSDKPKVLSISFESDPTASLGAQLNNCDKGLTEEMFIPSYATIGRLVEGETVAKKAGVQVADCIVAVNGQGFRRFAPDYADDQLEDITLKLEGTTVSSDNNNNNTNSHDKARVLHGSTGDNYKSLLARIKEIKAGPEPLLLSLERYDWDAKVNAWPRFLAARDADVPAAMAMMQQHEQWRQTSFPMDLTSDGLQHILKLKAVSEIDIDSPDHYPTVYVNYAKLQQDNSSSNGDVVEHVVQAFLIFTEIMLSRATDPRHPKTCQFVDLTGVKIGSGFRVDILKKIYQTFEPNYPETLHKMILYPVSKTVSYTSKMLLSFVNERTQKKFVITDSLERVCQELGWDQGEVEACGGVSEFMHKHEKAGGAMIFE